MNVRDGDTTLPAVGIIVNPHAGKDIRRLVSAAGQTSDAAKVGIVRRVVIGALEHGAQRLLLSRDANRLAEHAVRGIDAPIEFVDTPLTGSSLDSVAAADVMRQEGAGALVVLGGDGTCRDVATGWPDAPIVAISTGTNSVFPSAVEGTAAGAAAAIVACGNGPTDEHLHTAKRVTLVTPASEVVGRSDIALVEAALVRASFVGARAVTDPDRVAWVAACIADPASTGLASIAGRVHPVGRNEPGGVLVHLGPGGRPLRVPLTPGTFSTVQVRSVEPLYAGAGVTIEGGGVLAFDGERTVRSAPGTTVTVCIESDGPRVIDVRAVLVAAARAHCFESSGLAEISTPRTSSLDAEGKENHGD